MNAEAVIHVAVSAMDPDARADPSQDHAEMRTEDEKLRRWYGPFFLDDSNQHEVFTSGICGGGVLTFRAKVDVPHHTSPEVEFREHLQRLEVVHSVHNVKSTNIGSV